MKNSVVPVIMEYEGYKYITQAIMDADTIINGYPPFQEFIQAILINKYDLLS